MNDEIPTNSSPYPMFGEDPNVTTPPLSVPGYPQSDIPPNSTGGNITQVPNVHNTVGVTLESQFDTQTQLERLMRQNAELLARLETAENTPKAPPAPVQLVGGGAPVPHYLHLIDGRVIEDHGGIGTHYSETLPDGSTKVTRIRAFYPVDELSPVASIS